MQCSRCASEQEKAKESKRAMQENQFASMPKLPPARQSQFLATAEKLIPNQPFWVAETSKILSEAKDLTLRLAYVW